MDKNTTALVTGGAGFIGSHLCEELLKRGAHVIAVDNFLTGNKNNIAHLTSPDFEFIEADVTQPTDTYLPAGTHLDFIFHFASPASPPIYQAHPVETYLVNSIATHHLLQYIKNTSPSTRFLFASTSEIYGDPLEHPQKESYWGNVNPNGTRSCYDEAKRLGETICGVHQRDFGLDVRIVRIFNTYGPRMDINDGRVIPNFIKELLAHQPLTIYGEGKQTRSYCYVTDLVEAILSLATSENGNGKTVNLGNSDEFTILETAQILQEVSGTKCELQFLPLPKDDPTRRRPDISYAKELLGWEPTLKFRDGLKLTLEFFQG